jgi:hypothetical protein
MGMFDTIHYTCPHCSAVMGVQTKSGVCELRNYTASKSETNLPPSLMTQIAEEHEDDYYGHHKNRIKGIAYPGPVKCESCGEKFVLKLFRNPQAVLVPYEEEE